MKLLSLQLPGFSPIPSPVPNLKPEFVNIASMVSGLLNIALYIATFLAFYFLVWGAFQYITAGGGKEDLAKARARITWALVGLMVVFMAFLMARFAAEIFPPGKGGVPF